MDICFILIFWYFRFSLSHIILEYNKSYGCNDEWNDNLIMGKVFFNTGYLRSNECKVLVFTSKKLLFTFFVTDFENSHLAIFDKNNSSSSVLLYERENLPYTYLSSGNIIGISNIHLFKARSRMNIFFEEFGCGYSKIVSPSEGYLIISVQSIIFYPEELENSCRWMITVPPGNYVNLTIQTLEHRTTPTSLIVNNLVHGTAKTHELNQPIYRDGVGEIHTNDILLWIDADYKRIVKTYNRILVKYIYINPCEAALLVKFWPTDASVDVVKTIIGNVISCRVNMFTFTDNLKGKVSDCSIPIVYIDSKQTVHRAITNVSILLESPSKYSFFYQLNSFERDGIVKP
ncbi:hypothetical protein MXB_4139, partial [Myxobolus squamalis]